MSEREKNSVFLLAVLTLVTITGLVMYVTEGESRNFNDIRTNFYHATLTLMTVGKAFA